MKRSTGLLLLALVCTPVAAEPLTPEALAARIDAYVRPYAEAGHVSGNLLVARGETVVYERSFGMANFELEVPNGPETLFNVASVSKPMTVVVLIGLAVEGKLAMDDPLAKWIPDFPRGDEITVGNERATAGSVVPRRRRLRLQHGARPQPLARRGAHRQARPRPKGSFEDDTGIDWNGVTNGFRAFADWHKPTDVTVVFTGNLQTGAANRFRRDLPRIAAGEEIEAPPPPHAVPVAVDETALRRWEGVYELRPGSPLRVAVHRGALNANDWVLVPTGERTFFSPQDYATVEVVVDDAGRPIRLDWSIDGEPFPCPRIGDLS